jgi:hypothetical protein
MKREQTVFWPGRKLKSSAALIQMHPASSSKKFVRQNERLKRGVSTLSFDHMFVNSYGCGGPKTKAKEKQALDVPELFGGGSSRETAMLHVLPEMDARMRPSYQIRILCRWPKDDAFHLRLTQTKVPALRSA